MTSPDQIVASVQAELASLGTAENREKSKRFFKGEEKETVITHGVPAVQVKAVVRRLLAATRNFDKASAFLLAETFWQSGIMEEGWLACELAHSRRDQFRPADLEVFSAWIDAYVTNWAACDTLCNHSVGTLAEMFPSTVRSIRAWTRSPNRWKKRASAVSLIIPARKGLFLEDVFRIAEALLADPDDMVQKGYGWALKAASEAHCNEVYDFVTARKATMPRTAYRYALEKMPPDLRAAAMKKERLRFL